MVLDVMPSETQLDFQDTATQGLEEIFVKKLEISKDLGMGMDHQSAGHLVIEDTKESEAPIKYSSSQHYHHSAHIASSLHPLQPSTQDVAARTLIKNGIAPSTLLRCQLNLFEHSGEEQRSRLIELWRVVPPTYARNGSQPPVNRFREYDSTSLIKEEEVARLKYWNSFSEEDRTLVGNCTGDSSLLGSQVLPDQTRLPTLQFSGQKIRLTQELEEQPKDDIEMDGTEIL